MVDNNNPIQASVMDVLQLEKMQKCNCPSGLEVLFFCKNASCPDQKKQQYYCLDCSNDESKHDHRVIPIVREIQAQHQQWESLRRNISTAFTRASESYENLKHLIKYIEKAMLSEQAQISSTIKWFSVDYDKLKEINEEIQKLYNDSISAMFVNVLLVELIEMNGKYNDIL